ncbi:hypothetical protein [Ammoniphilus sp. YIM 78166]|uniref:hypothetical protein n=1 Tax=Ammoniphilus sp. YIM 78166 TaxID=1644106 RepID=UPI00106F8A5D|nr:hypothetical protein [Ammoniphilus sp. YIM 78166]
MNRSLLSPSQWTYVWMGVKDVQDLEDMKEQIKNQIIDPSMDWKTRMDLYSQIRLINEHIIQSNQRTSY